ncbi:unnamed protein product [Porites evermanni]|uniref:Cilia- and flagella-associated protein 36 n=1 Tax=Porites evermanni TaxID=104178 RepID=A0ABN8N5A7_9CNID|nr:unnamed protein product [Porites evermanni]
MSASEREFIFDAVIGYLTSPIWNFPVRTFIEHNSLVFDPDGENHEEYKKIHKSYKDMVDKLLASFLKDVGITAEQFMNACKEGSGSPQFSRMHRDVFDQLWAAEDYEVFKQLMIQKNIELQLQALQIIQHIHNVPMPMPMPGPVPTPPSAASTPGSPPAPIIDEDAIMQEVLRRSKEEYESQKSGKGKAEQEFEKTLAESKEESERLKEIAKKEHEELEKALQISLEAQKQQAAEAEKLRDEVKQSTVQPSAKPPDVESKQAAKTSTVESKPVPKPSPSSTKSPAQDTKRLEKPQTTGLPPLSGKPKKAADTPADAAAGWLQSAKEDAASSTAKPVQKQEITPEEMKRRSEYLKQQRDKLLALKRQEREKSLTKYTEQESKARPMSAHTARRVTAGEQVDSPPSKSSQEDANKLAMRRALADCLKREVIDKD